MRRLLISSFAFLSLNACFTDDYEPQPCVYTGFGVPDQWCVELVGAQFSNRAGVDVDLLDPDTTGFPKGCACMSAEQSSVLSNPALDPVMYEDLVDTLRDAAMERCEELANDLGLGVWETTCADIDPEPNVTYAGDCPQTCTPFEGGDATAGGGAGYETPPPELGLTSWGDAVTCPSTDECVVDEVVVQQLVADPALLLGDSARFAANESRFGATGMQLVVAEPGSMVMPLGLQLDDILVGVNGMPLEGVDDVLMAAIALQSAASIDLEIHRGTEIVTKTYTFGAP